MDKYSSCKQCQTRFVSTRNWQDFCTNKCRSDYHNGLKTKVDIEHKTCVQCGIPFSTNNKKQSYCSAECRRSAHLHRFNNNNSISKINPDELGDRLRLFYEVIENWNKFKNQTHCAYCGKSLNDKSLHPFCNSVCQKHYIFDVKK